MYFGQYPEGYNNNPEFTDRQAIVMVGTRSSNGNYNTSKDIYVGKDNSIVAYIGDLPCPYYCVDPTKPLPHQKAPVGFTLVEGEQGLSVM